MFSEILRTMITSKIHAITLFLTKPKKLASLSKSLPLMGSAMLITIFVPKLQETYPENLQNDKTKLTLILVFFKAQSKRLMAP